MFLALDCRLVAYRRYGLLRDRDLDYAGATGTSHLPRGSTPDESETTHMADRSKATAKSRVAKTKTPAKAKATTKSASTKSSASKKSATKTAAASKTATASKRARTSAASRSTKAATKTTARKPTAAAKKAVAAKTAPKKAAPKKAVPKKAALKNAVSKSGAKTKAPVKAASKATKKPAAAKTAKTKAPPAKAAKPAAKKAAPKAAAKAAKKPAAKTSRTSKPTAKQTAAARKAIMTEAAKKFQSAAENGKPQRVSGSTRAAALAARSIKPKQAAARALAAAASNGVGGKKVSAPLGGPGSPKSIAEKTAAARSSKDASKRSINQRHGFKTNEYVVYPAHGVGKIIGIEDQEIAGMALELFVIHFEKEKLTLRVPTGKLESVGMRKLSEDGIVTKSMTVLKGRARIKRTMWSRRAQESIAKINSGDLVQIAEVVRDLYRSDAQPEQSYSERQLYEDALDRMAREVAAVEKLDERGAVQRITEVLSKSARSRRAAEEASDEEAAASSGDSKAA